jgi:hypothetical protein
MLKPMVKNHAQTFIILTVGKEIKLKSNCKVHCVTGNGEVLLMFQTAMTYYTAASSFSAVSRRLYRADIDPRGLEFFTTKQNSQLDSSHQLNGSGCNVQHDASLTAGGLGILSAPDLTVVLVRALFPGTS